MSKTKYDFSGYATKSGLKCTDGRTILKDAFKHQDGMRVPLVWAHCHDDPENILGHAILENREDGVYCYGYFNDTEKGKAAKISVQHGDITSLSIYSNQLKEQTKNVIHGDIKEVSLVLAGANSGAKIDNLCFAHGDSFDTDETEAIIYTGLKFTEDETIVHENKEEKKITEIFDTLNEEQKEAVSAILAHAAGKETDLQHAKSDATVKDIFDTFNEDQKKVVYYMIGAALQEADTGSAEHSNLNEEGDNIMKNNVFDASTQEGAKNVLTHDQLRAIIDDVGQYGGSLSKSFIAHAETYGFDPIDILFPDAKDVNAGGPVTIKRNDAWVADVLADTTHTPFSRIKTRFADLTPEEARAKGYVTGSLKKEQIVALTKRVTTPTTIYKKQKLDRDDIIDITDFDVVIWLKKEMRGMLDEEIARAVLIGDGRTVGDEDKINEGNVRPIALDDGNVFVQRVSLDATLTAEDIIDEFIKARKYYKGSGVPALYCSTDLLTDMLLVKDKMGRRMYNTMQELASVLRVSKIVEVEPMNTAVRMAGDDEYPILGIVVNLKDYTIGADRGGEVSLFDDFDIDYNQYKYLIETRISGALTKPKSAIVIERKPAEVAG
jgi:hypothetical protein